MSEKISDETIEKVTGGDMDKVRFFKCVYCGRRDNEIQMRNEEGSFCVESSGRGHHFVAEEDLDDYFANH